MTMRETIEKTPFQTSSETTSLTQLIDFPTVVDNLYQKGAIHLPKSEQDIPEQLSNISVLAMKTIECSEREYDRRHATRTIVGAAIYVACKRLGIKTTYQKLGWELGVTPNTLAIIARQLMRARHR